MKSKKKYRNNKKLKTRKNIKKSKSSRKYKIGGVSPSDEYHYVDSQRQRQGPVNADELKKLFKAGKIDETTLVWPADGSLTDWTSLSDVPGLLDHCQASSTSDTMAKGLSVREMRALHAHLNVSAEKQPPAPLLRQQSAPARLEDGKGGKYRKHYRRKGRKTHKHKSVKKSRKHRRRKSNK